MDTVDFLLMTLDEKVLSDIINGDPNLRSSLNNLIPESYNNISRNYLDIEYGLIPETEINLSRTYDQEHAKKFYSFKLIDPDLMKEKAGLMWGMNLLLENGNLPEKRIIYSLLRADKADNDLVNLQTIDDRNYLDSIFSVLDAVYSSDKFSLEGLSETSKESLVSYATLTLSNFQDNIDEPYCDLDEAIPEEFEN